AHVEDHRRLDLRALDRSREQQGGADGNRIEPVFHCLPSFHFGLPRSRLRLLSRLAISPQSLAPRSPKFSSRSSAASRQASSRARNVDRPIRLLKPSKSSMRLEKLAVVPSRRRTS